MKLKRFLALAVSAIMVMAMVPAMSVSAAGTTGVIDALGGEVLWSCPDGSFNDTAIGTAFSGWSSNITSGYVNVKTYSVGNVIQYYVNGTENKTTITSPGYGGEGEDAIVIEWKMKRQNPKDLYFDFSFTDKNGTEIAFLKLDKNYTSVSGEYYMGYPVDGTDCAIVATNNGDGTHKVQYYVGGSVVSTVASKSGEISGFGGITSSNGRWSKAWNHIGFADFTIGAVSFSETRVEVTAEYTVEGTVVHTETGYYDTAEGETGVTFPAYSYSANGSNVMYHTDGATLSESGTIALEVVANAGTHAVGDVFAKDGVQYEIKSANLIPNGDFSYGTKGWYGADFSNAGFFTSNGDGTMTLTAGGTNAGGASSLYRAWAIEKEKTYLFTFDANTENIYDKVSVKDDISATADGTVILDGAVADTNTVIFTAANDYIQVNFRWLGAGQIFGNFGLYEIAEAEVAVQETVASVAEIAPVKVIGDTTVVLPSTVAVTGSLGSEIDAPIVWDAPATYEVGTTTVEGVATIQFGEQTATTADVSTTVTVLEETFTLEGFTSANGQTDAKANQVAFPKAISDAFSIEFIANYASFGDLFITMKTKDAGFFGPEQVALGANASGSFRPVDGNGTGGRNTNPDRDLAPLTAGTNYRIFVEADASTDKYTVTVCDAATGVEVAKAENFGFRTNAAAIEVITALTNNGKGEVTLSDIKVNSTITKDEYTFVTTIDGNTTTTTASFWSAAEAEASVEDIENYHKKVVVDGTTITVVYTNMTVVKEEIANIAEINDITVFVTDEITLPEAVKVTGTFETEVDAAIVWDAPTTFPAGTTELTGAISVQFGEAEPIETTVSMNVTVIDEFTLPDTESFGAQPGNIVTFPVQIKNNFTMEFDYTINQIADASIQMGGDAGKLFGSGALGISHNGGALKARGESNPVLIEEVNAGETYHMILQMNAADDTYTLYVEKADGSVVTATEGFRKAQEYIDTMSVLVNGIDLDNKGTLVVSNITVNAKDVELCSVTVNGEVAEVIKGRSYKAQTTGIATDDAGTVYYAENGVAEILVEGDMTITTQELGLAMVDGAQVRVGNTELEEGEKLNALADSGLRFLATADYNDTLVVDADEFGIKITAEGSENVVYVKADKFQNDDNSVFSAAITNLNESNYNRKYTAVAYAKFGDIEITTGSVTRSIYQVSAGIMKNGNAGEDAPYTVDGVVKNILNAYVNQTGIRLSYTADGIAVEENKYTGDVFFTVESVSDGDDGFNVTITPDASWGTPAEIAQWWTEYVRFNNNNSIAKGYISGAEFVDGALTFNFDTTVD